MNTHIVSDTLHWTKVQGSFIANGTERLITIGNFTDTANMDFVPVWDTTAHQCICTSSTAISCYLVDDVSVIRSDATANAGPDQIIAVAGDTVLIGDTLDSYVPTYWYANGTLIDSNKSGIFVHPDTTTTYVVGLQLCGGVSYDTVIVRLASDTVHTDTVHTDTTRHDSTSHVYVQPLQYSKVRVYPNPAHDNITIEQAKGCEMQLLNAVGETVLRKGIYATHEIENIQGVTPGLYLLQITDPVTGYRLTKKVLKE